MKKHLFALFIILIMANSLFAQDQRLFKSLTVSDGLPHSEITSIVQDKTGFLWLGTLNGLTRYDGNSMKTYIRNNSSDSNSLSNIRIISLYHEGDSLLYIGTEGGGLNIFNLRRENFENHAVLRQGELLSTQVIYTIKKGMNNRIWVGTDNGLWELQKQGNTFSYRSFIPNLQMVTDVEEIDQDILWLTSNTGVYEVNKHTKQQKLLFDHHWTCIQALSSNTYLLGGVDGLFLYSGQGALKKLLDVNTVEICITSNQDIWVGAMNDGLYRFGQNLDLKESYQYGHIRQSKGLSNNNIRAFCEDFSGNLWIGTRNGLNKVTLGGKEFEVYNSILDENIPKGQTIRNKTATFFEDEDGRLWIGSQATDLRILDRKTQTIQTIDSRRAPELANETISAFFQDRNGSLWIGTWSNLFVLPKIERTKVSGNATLKLTSMLQNHHVPAMTIFKIIEDKDGELWMSTNRGVYRYIPSKEDYYKGTFVNYGNSAADNSVLTNNFMTDIFVDQVSAGANKIIWAGSSNGLNKLLLTKEGMKIIHIKNDTTATGLKGEFISVIHQDGNSDLWVIGIDGWMNKLTGNRYNDAYPEFQSFNINENGTFNTTESLQEDGYGNFWMGGVRLIRFDPKLITYRYFDEQDGLQSNSFKIWSSYKLRSGELVFGGINGFTIFAPQNFKDNKIIPRVAFTDLAIFDKEIKPLQEYEGRVILTQSLNETENITLPYDMNSISISFVALHFVSSSKNNYRYMLEGEDKGWRYVQGNKNRAIYTNLKPGTYTFKVYGSNCDNLWTDNPRNIEIVVTPPFWKTTTAYFLYFCSFIIALLLFRRNLILTEKRKNALIMEHHMREEENKLHQMKLKFFTDVSHELKTPLALIYSPVEDLINEPGLDVLVARKLMFVRRNIGRLMNLVEQIMDFRRIDNNMMQLAVTQENIVNLCRAVMCYFEDEAERRSIRFMFRPDKENLEIWIDKEKIEKVLMNIIGNAFKYTKNGGEILVNCGEKDGKVIINIHDDGLGIKADDVNHIFERYYQGENSTQGGTGIGLALAKAIVEQHQGRIWVESEYNKGTNFYVELLLGKEQFDEEKVKVKLRSEVQVPSVIPDVLEVPDVINDMAGDSLLSGEKAVILVVDDNIEMLTYLEESLSNGFTVMTAVNGELAWKVTLKEEIDLIVSDVMMPVMDGIELCSKIKNDIRLSHIPVILLTAKGEVEHKIEGYESGADDYIPKPFNLKLLVVRINNIIRQRNDLRIAFRKQIVVEPTKLTVTTLDEQLLKKCMELIETNISDPDFNVDELCRGVGLSRPAVYKKVKSLTGLSVVEFIRSIRLKRAAQLLAQDNSSISDVMYKVGFNNRSYFSLRFKEEFGCNPNEYKAEESSTSFTSHVNQR